MSRNCLKISIESGISPKMGLRLMQVEQGNSIKLGNSIRL